MVVIFIAITITVIAILTYFMRRAHKTNTAIYDLPAADYEEKVPRPPPVNTIPVKLDLNENAAYTQVKTIDMMENSAYGTN